MQILLKILIFTLPLVCSNLPEFFGFSDIFRINGSYEFSKVLYFNIFSSIIIIYYGVLVLLRKQSLKISENTMILLGLFFLVNIFSTLFSLFPMQSLLGGTSKGHGFFMWNNLMGLAIIFLSLDKKILNSLIKIFLCSMFTIVLFGIWQYYFPSFDYGNLSNRALSTLGHPNYLAGLILVSIPLISHKEYIRDSLMRNIGFYLLIFCLFLTKSFLAIGLALLYFISQNIKFNRHNCLILTILLLIGSVTLLTQFPEKLHSFVSRFYIWETTVRIMWSDISQIFIGFGSETLTIYFDSFKSAHLYIFENFGFTADRPHNIFLNFFYHFGIIGLGIIITIYVFIFKNISSVVGKSLLLISLFLLFNYVSIVGYLIIVILLSILIKTKEFPQTPLLKGGIIGLYLLVSLSSIVSIYYSSKLYMAEQSIYQSEGYDIALWILPDYQIYQYKSGILSDKIESEDYYLEKLYSSNDYTENCLDLTIYFPSAENYFYCGEILEKIGDKSLSKQFYTNGLKKIPDLWNPESKYWKNYIIKKSVSGNRFYSPKYGNIGEILKKLDTPTG